MRNHPKSTPQSKPGKIKVAKGWENANPAFAQGPSRYMIVGVANTGKTTLAVRVIKQILQNPKDPHHQLVIISPNYQRDPKLQALAQHASQLKIKVRVYTSFDKASMQKFVEFMDDVALHNVRSLVYIDDPVGVGTFTANVNQKSPWNSFVTGSKHYKADIVFSTQAVGAMSRSARKNIDVFIFLPDMTSRVELFESCRFVSTQGQFDKLMDRYAYQPYCALWINVQFGRKGVYCIDANGTISSITEVPR